MSFNLTKTDGSSLTTIEDGTINTTSTSLTLIGKNYPGYGTFLNENFVQLLENFSNSSSPANPLQGQLWFNSQTKVLSVYSNNSWKAISGAQNQAEEPANRVAGDLWFDSVNQQLKIWSGTSWVLIGPSFTSITGASGAFAETVQDVSGFTHVVVKFLVQNTLVAILSKDAVFTPATTITGFATIGPGMNLSTTGSLLYNGDAYNALRLGGVEASQYARADQASFTNTLIISAPAGGLEIRDGDAITKDFSLTATQNHVNLTGWKTGWGMKLVTYPTNSLGNSYDALKVDPTSGELIAGYVSPAADQGLSTKRYVDLKNTDALEYTDAAKAYNKSYTDVLWTNANVTFSTVETLKGNLGFNNTNYNNITASSNFADYITALETNFNALKGNVLSGYTIGPTPISSLWGNVQSVTTRVKALEDNDLRADGMTTIKGALTPDNDNQRDLGTSAAKFRKIYTYGIDIGALTSVSSITSVTATPSTYADKGVASDSNISVYSSVIVGGNISFDQTNLTNSGRGPAGFTGNVSFWGPQTFGGNVTPLLDARLSMGSSTKRFANVYAVVFNGVATSAQYADLAEQFKPDALYTPGTVVRIGGDEEITIENEELSTEVFGVISTDPAFKMNSELEGGNYVALAGRVPTRIVGPVRKGQRLVAAGNGAARGAKPEELTAFNCIGRSLVNKTSEGEELVEAVVKLVA